MPTQDVTNVIGPTVELTELQSSLDYDYLSGDDESLGEDEEIESIKKKYKEFKKEMNA